MATISNVVHLSPPPLAQPESRPQLKGPMRVASRVLANVLLVSAALFALAVLGVLVAMVFYRGDGLQIGATGMWLGTGQGPPGYQAFGSLPLHHRLIYVLVGLVRYTPALLILLNLSALFRLYAQGSVFGRSNAMHLRAVGLWLVVDAVLPFVVHLLLSATGYEIDRNWMHIASLQKLFAGAMLFVIAEVMKVGSEIEEERSQFV
ncbi:DUF2975 domain-containing protein [Sandaracinobacteroides hominis]|uniref:DUF2975 domain-containing protein n=1 Tax=Sandaracinobacteroides hominis TaxID=2780086 RepID=UPI0018F59160|nr:DUF2975 domain-containing protein [Sandaracinobacteroides hominis]